MKSTSEPAAMRWTPGEAIFVPSGELGWMRSHAALPVPLHLHDDVYRVYVSGRTERNQAQIGYIEVDLEDPAKTLRVSGEPVIRLGGLGAHDESGVTGACVVRAGDRLYQYYTGWSLMTTVPFVFHIGLAISEDGGETFEKVSEGPVLGRSRMDPYLVASPSVLIEDGAWRMWYVSGARWEDAVGGPKHYYHIRYAESRDGIDWRPTGRVCIDFLGAEEYAFGRPMVRKISDGYEMWDSVRGDADRIG